MRSAHQRIQTETMLMLWLPTGDPCHPATTASTRKERRGSIRANWKPRQRRKRPINGNCRRSMPLGPVLAPPGLPGGRAFEVFGVAAPPDTGGGGRSLRSQRQPRRDRVRSPVRAREVLNGQLGDTMSLPAMKGCKEPQIWVQRKRNWPSLSATNSVCSGNPGAALISTP